MSDDKKSYEVGYGKPPASGQFRKGKSGNPRGRPKGVRNFKKLLNDMLSRRVILNANGERKSVSLVEATLLRLGEGAMKGDLKAIDKIMSLSAQLFDEETAAAKERALSIADQEILERFSLHAAATQPDAAADDAGIEENDDDQNR